MGLIELMIGLALVSVGILGLNSLAISAMRGNLTSRLTDQGTRLAQQKIEQIKSAGYAAAAVGTVVESNLDAAGNGGGSFTRTTVIAAGTVPTTRTITVTVRWVDQTWRTISVVTHIVQS